MKRWTVYARRRTSSGMAMVGLLVIALIVAGSIGATLLYVTHTTHETQRYAASTDAFNAAEGGLRRSLYMLQARDDWKTFATNATVAWTSLPSGGAQYTFTFSGISADNITVTSTGRKPFAGGYAYRKIQAKVQHPLPEAFGFAMFGNRVGFHNHMKGTYEFTITSKVWSNHNLLIWRGLTMDGNMTAVNLIVPDSAPGAGIPATVMSGTFLDGVPGSKYYAPDLGQPVPQPIPFPQYDFAGAKTEAQAKGTYFATAAAFQSYIAARTTKYSPAQAYAFPSPIPENVTRTLTLTTADGKTAGIASKAVLKDSLFYVNGDVTLSAQCNALIVIQNAGLVVDGKVTVKCPLELYASPSYPAIAATGKIDITDKDHTDGDGGPVNIKGIIYTTAECHIHQSDEYNSVSVEGIEVADYIHNCEWFWFKYAPWPGVKGFSEGTGAQDLTMSQWRELPAGPP